MSNRAAFNSTRKRVQVLLLLIVGLFAALPAEASDREDKKFPVSIKNFGQVNEHVYRGAQPKGDDFRALAALGVKTVINLRKDNIEKERVQVEAAGMKYISIPLSDSTAPKEEDTLKFLDLMKDSANGPYYVHCAGGRHRTGIMLAAYRMTHYNWDVDQAYREMKEFDFYTRWGHGAMKDYVYSYYKQMRRKPVTEPVNNINTENNNNDDDDDDDNSDDVKSGN